MSSAKRDLSKKRKFLIDHLSKDPFMVESQTMIILGKKPADAPLTLEECTRALKAHQMNDSYLCNSIMDEESEDCCIDFEGNKVRKLCYGCSWHARSENFLKYFCKNW